MQAWYDSKKFLILCTSHVSPLVISNALSVPVTELSQLVFFFQHTKGKCTFLYGSIEIVVGK